MDDKKLKKWASRGASVAQLGAGLGAEVVDVVERMHGSISRAPLPLGKLENDSARGLAGFVYSCVKGGFEASHLGLRKLAEQWQDADDDNPRWSQIRAAINGVCGDSLLARGNPLAQPMVFVNEQAVAEDADSSQPQTLLLFVHGLCMSEQGWFDGVHQQSATALAKRLNARVAYLRYNSGLHISENGEQLAHLLKDYAANDARIVIVGHSMGGLLSRSASFYAQQHGCAWLSKLSHVVTLGTPHDGAPAERLGNMANTILMASPYTNPLSRLGNIRSAGIRDLRFSNLQHSDWQGIEDPDHYNDLRTPVPLNNSTEYLFVAGTRSELMTDNPLDAKHDLLVTVASAWAMGEKPEFVLQGDNINRVALAATDHMRLQWSCEVYDEINAWLDDLADE